MWDLPGPGIKPVFPTLAGGFLTTVLPGKSLYCVLISCLFNKYLLEAYYTMDGRNTGVKETDTQVSSQTPEPKGDERYCTSHPTAGY